MVVRVDVGAGRTEIEGRVTRDGSAVERAYIRITDLDGEFVTEVWCGPAGEFRLGLEPGEWRLVCLAPKARVERTIQLRQVDHADVDVLLQSA